MNAHASSDGYDLRRRRQKTGTIEHLDKAKATSLVWMNKQLAALTSRRVDTARDEDFCKQLAKEELVAIDELIATAKGADCFGAASRSLAHLPSCHHPVCASRNPSFRRLLLASQAEKTSIGSRRRIA